MSRVSPLSTAFLAALEEPVRDAFQTWPALPAELSSCLKDARRAWPDVAIDDLEFVQYLAERVSPEDGHASLPSHTSDLYLACACARGDDKAIAHFDDHILGRIDPVIRSVGLSPGDADEIKQDLRCRLLLGTGDKGPRILSYQGSGALVHWAKAVAGRQALTVLRQRRPQTPIDEDILDTSDDPHLQSMKESYRAEFREAFLQAVSELSDEDRRVLRALVVHETSVAQIADDHRIHRVTASRWIAKIRLTLLHSTRRHLRNRLSLSLGELDSVMHLIESRLEVSLFDVLTTREQKSA